MNGQNKDHQSQIKIMNVLSFFLVEIAEILHYNILAPRPRNRHGNHNSHDNVRIPCEFCNEQIDIEDWSSHTVNV